MVNNMHETKIVEDDIEITTETTDTDEPELSDVEENQNDIISSLRKQLKEVEAEKRAAQEELQRAKADFLNARKRLDEERGRDRERTIVRHLEELIPLCDSFEMAMLNKEVWEKVDHNWRKGIEGIYAQLNNLLTQYRVTRITPHDQAFDPRRHEALSTEPVTSKDMHGIVTKVVQPGYEISHQSGAHELIRPARVIIGEYSTTT